MLGEKFTLDIRIVHDHVMEVRWFRYSPSAKPLE